MASGFLITGKVPALVDVVVVIRLASRHDERAFRNDLLKHHLLDSRRFGVHAREHTWKIDEHDFRWDVRRGSHHGHRCWAELDVGWRVVGEFGLEDLRLGVGNSLHDFFGAA